MLGQVDFDHLLVHGQVVNSDTSTALDIKKNNIFFGAF